MLLKRLCEPQAREELEGIIHSQKRSKNEERQIRNGFKLMIATGVYSIFEGLIASPDFVGFGPDDGPSQWLGWGRWTNANWQASIDTPNSDLAKTLEGIQSILSALRESGDSLEEADHAYGQVLDVANSLLTVGLSCPVSMFRSDIAPISTERAMELRAGESLDDDLHARASRTSEAFSFVWGNETGTSMVSEELYDMWGDRSIDNIRTLRSPVGVGNRREVPNWGLGLLAAISLSLHRLGLGEGVGTDANDTFQQFVDQEINVAESVTAAVKRPFAQCGISNQYPSLHFGLKASTLQLDCDFTSFQEESMKEISELERLTRLFGDVEKIVVSEDSPLGWLDFRDLVAGMMANTAPSGRVKVVRVNHSDIDEQSSWDLGSYIDFSLAVQTPAYGSRSNAPKWWVFYKIYGTGVPDGEAVQSEDGTKSVLAEFNDRIDLQDFNGVSAEDFLDLCNPPAFQALRAQAKALDEINRDLKGIVPELLAALLLVRQGCHPVRTSHQRKEWDNRELDVVGVFPKTGVAIVVEAKGGSVTDKELESNIKRFSETVGKVKEALPKLAESLGLQAGIKDVVGRFISMADLTDQEGRFSQYGVEVWDYNRFQEELISAGISRRYRNALEEVRLTIVIDDGAYGDASLLFLKSLGLPGSLLDN